MIWVKAHRLIRLNTSPGSDSRIPNPNPNPNPSRIRAGARRSCATSTSTWRLVSREVASGRTVRSRSWFALFVRSPERARRRRSYGATAELRNELDVGARLNGRKLHLGPSGAVVVRALRQVATRARRRRSDGSTTELRSELDVGARLNRRKLRLGPCGSVVVRALRQVARASTSSAHPWPRCATNTSTCALRLTEGCSTWQRLSSFAL